MCSSALTGEVSPGTQVSDYATYQDLGRPVRLIAIREAISQ